jgi:hypothetical protein
LAAIKELGRFTYSKNSFDWNIFLNERFIDLETEKDLEEQEELYRNYRFWKK